jgi:flagellar biosynthesis protein FlhF
VEVKDNPLEEEVRQLRAQLEAQNVGQLQTEIEQLKTLMKQFSQPQTVAEEAPEAGAAARLPERPEGVAERSPRPDVTRLRTPRTQAVDDLVALLQERGIESEAAQTIARFAAPQMNERQRSQPDQCLKHLSATLAGLVQTTGPLWSPGESQKRVALIGATGVGKTTTIAKLAAEAMANGARVALVTIDTYRIAAVEQLKVYAEIMGLPVAVVLSPEQLQAALRNHRDKDLILIDTAGRSPRDQLRIDELNEFLGQGAEVENCLVLAAPTEERLQRQSLEAFSQLPLSRLIFTKLDETDRCGGLINIPTRANLPLAYLTNGQQVPEDLLAAEAGGVANLVLGISEESGRIAV